jgi:hypothetical protein
MPDGDIAANPLTIRLELFIGRRRTGISVHPDPDWPGMWRVHRGTRVSDMVNLARAKDAAIAWYTQEQGRGLRQGDTATWRRGVKAPDWG